MNLRFFIDRPVFSGVISVVIVLMGVIAIQALPVEQYPDIAPPTINVWATYPGANAASGQERDREYSRRPSNSSMCRGYFRQVSQSIRFPTSL